jgi:short-subunit dehydrogenase
MSSLSGKLATPIGSSYSATKFALVGIISFIFDLFFPSISQHGYFDAMRSELADQNIKVTMVCPGPVESEIHLHTKRSKDAPITVFHFYPGL